MQVGGVCYLAKIRILTDLTTKAMMHNSTKEVFVILQRYEF